VYSVHADTGRQMSHAQRLRGTPVDQRRSKLRRRYALTISPVLSIRADFDINQLTSYTRVEDAAVMQVLQCSRILYRRVHGVPDFRLDESIKLSITQRVREVIAVAC
jgi:hypothetical protein